MADANYEKIVDKIAENSGIDKEEVKRKIEAKRAKLSELISYEGAAQIVAAEQGINFENQTLKINELLPGMRKANLKGKIINQYPVRTFQNKKGEESKVANLFIADDTSNIKTVLWDMNHISMLENGTISQGTTVDINNASMRGNELHLGSYSEIKKSDQEIESPVTEKIVNEKIVSDLAVSDNAQVRAFVVQVFNPKTFNVCPECGKKVSTDGENQVCVDHGNVTPKRRGLLNIVLDDGTETIRAVVFHDNLEKLGITELENQENINSRIKELKGKELIISGNVKTNRYFNEPEFVVEDIGEVNTDDLIKKLENKQ
ncbi:MAG: DUF2240 family protein [Candidatus Pacearchaeota archaeon]